VRGGFWYEPWAIPEQNFNPAFLDLSRYGISTGFGYALTKNLGLDFAYTAVFFHNRHINNNQDSNTAALALLGQQPPSSDGTYKDFANLVALNFTYRFGAHN
jgi:long-subunit fatty acid transport protein